MFLMEDGKWERFRPDGANAAAEVLRIDERGEDRHSFHSVPIGDPQRIEFVITNSGRWKQRVAEAWPLREGAEFVQGWTVNLLTGIVSLSGSARVHWTAARAL